MLTQPAASPSGQRWHKLASCSDLGWSVFFGANNDRPMSSKEVDRAKGVCKPCPARAECLLWALHEGEGWGVWGGYSRPERARALELFGSAEEVVNAHRNGALDLALHPVEEAVVA